MGKQKVSKSGKKFYTVYLTASTAEIGKRLAGADIRSFSNWVDTLIRREVLNNTTANPEGADGN